jgi:Tfp pilus assembly protein PilF
LVWLIATATLGGCVQATRSPLASAPGDQGHQTIPDPASTRATTETLENTVQDLADARLRLLAAPTVENHRGVATAYFRRGLLDSAFDHFTAAIALDRRDALSYEGLARVWRDWGFPERALTEAHRAVYYGPSLAATYNTLGTILMKLGIAADAETTFERARRLDPTAAYITGNLCYAILTQGQIARAISRCHDALSLDPDERAARHVLALAYVAARDFESAEREFRLAGTASQAAYNMGMAYLDAGNLDEAARAFQTAWEADRSLRVAGERLQQVNVLRARAR